MSSEPARTEALDEVKRLQTCLDDLVSILALPAIWSGSDASHVARTLLDALVWMLRLDFACLRLMPPEGEAPIVIVRLAVRRGAEMSPDATEAAVARALVGAVPVRRARMPSPVGAGEVSVVPFRLGIQDEIGVLVAGSGRVDFPTTSETLVLRVAANQAAVAMREPRIIGERKRAQGVMDLTERREAEETLPETLAEPAHVARRATAGELAASIAHELNQPLAAVVTNGGACLRWLGHDPPNLEEAVKAVHRIMRDAERASDVIGNVRAFLQKSGRARTTLDITEVVREVLVLVEPEVTRHRVVVQERLAQDLPPVLGVRGELQQVLLNLIVNGIEAMAETPEGARSLIVSSQLHEVDRASGVLVAVEDTGVGLAEESLSRVFEAFHTTKPHGLGMGLSIAQSIVQSHGGRLWATRNPGRGATFQLVLPVSTAAS